jgi:hypothetical protein
MAQMKIKKCEYCKRPIEITPFYEHRPARYLARKFCGRQCIFIKHDGRRQFPILYRRWKDMRNRCNNPNNSSYKNYGGRGIKVCKRWTKFENFRDDMLSTFNPKLSLDRIDNNGDYSPDNCRWTNQIVQGENRRSTKPLLYKGKKQSLSAWAREVGLKRSTVSQRYYSYGWTLQQTLERRVVN